MSQFPADSILVSDVIASPNQGERAGHRTPNMIVLHYTGMMEGVLALERLCSPASGVSSHYFVYEDGRIIQCVPETRRAWHAGESYWAGETDINSCSIGIEIANPGHEFGYPDFPRRQIAATIALCRGIIKRRSIRADRILGHSDIAPGRKQDPGEKFPWHLLSESGVGHFVNPAPIIPGVKFEFGDRGTPISDIQTALAQYGYRIPTDGFFDASTKTAVTAFQRHFRPACVDGVIDSSTLITLRALLETRPAAAVHEDLFGRDKPAVAETERAVPETERAVSETEPAVAPVDQAASTPEPEVQPEIHRDDDPPLTPAP